MGARVGRVGKLIEDPALAPGLHVARDINGLFHAALG